MKVNLSDEMGSGVFTFLKRISLFAVDIFHEEREVRSPFPWTSLLRGKSRSRIAKGAIRTRLAVGATAR